MPIPNHPTPPSKVKWLAPNNSRLSQYFPSDFYLKENSQRDLSERVKISLMKKSNSFFRG